MNCRLSFLCTVKKARMAVESMWLLPQDLGAVTGIQECRETLRGGGGKEKKTLDRLLHESAVE